MFLQAFQKAFGVIVRKPLRLWGLSILSGVIAVLACLLTFPFMIIGIMFAIVVSAGMSMVYLDGVEGKQVYSDQLFAGFKSFFKVAGGIAWQGLWNVIWTVAAFLAAMLVMAIFSIIPVIGGYLGIFFAVIVAIAGMVLACIKSYSYRFVPYILMTMPEVNATEALRVSVKMTKGKKLHMWLADLVFGIAYFLIALIIGLLANIPYIGIIFAIVSVIISILVPLFQGLYQAAFFKMPVHTAPANPAYQRFENMANGFNNMAGVNPGVNPGAPGMNPSAPGAPGAYGAPANPGMRPAPDMNGMNGMNGR